MIRDLQLILINVLSLYKIKFFISDIAKAADEVRSELLTADEGAQYDRIVEINLDEVIYVFLRCHVCLSFVPV